MESLRKKWSRSRYYSGIFRANAARLDALQNALADERSREVLQTILRAYKAVSRPAGYYFTQAAGVPCTEHHFVTPDGYQVRGTRNPYFLPELFRLTPEMVYLDGGAYIGDTLQLLTETLGAPCRFAYAFEPNAENYKKLLATAARCQPDIQCFRCGLDDRDGTASFSVNDAASRIDSQGNVTIPVMNAGKFLESLTEHRPTFIKLDIEGREPAVLESMAPYLRRYTPDLAVSIYHKLEDLWEIPLQLQRICPEYRLYIRHQSNYFTETVCYATKNGV